MTRSGRVVSRRIALVAALGLAGVAACGSEGDADDAAAAQVTPDAAPDSLAATPSVPAGGQTGGAGTAGDNTGEAGVRASAGLDSARAARDEDSARHTPARVGSTGVRIRPPDTVANPIPPPPERVDP